MTNRMFFIVKDGKVLEKTIEFKYYSGFAVSQKQKSIQSLHSEITKEFSNNILEISSKSLDELGVKLSAFNLKVKLNNHEVAIENIFQASKVFEYGGPYLDLLEKTPLEAKKDERVRNSGRLVSFKFNGVTYPNQPLTAFYDWIYCCAILKNKELGKELINYSIFTDIEFNHEKSLNCQARSAAIFVALNNLNKLDLIKNFNLFIDFVYADVYTSFNTGLFENL